MPRYRAARQSQGQGAADHNLTMVGMIGAGLRGSHQEPHEVGKNVWPVCGTRVIINGRTEGTVDEAGGGVL